MALGMVQTFLQYIFFYIGMSHSDGIKGAIIGAGSTFFAIILAHFLVKGEHLTSQKIAGCILGFLGVLIINLTGGSVGGGFTLTGEGFLLISGASYALASVMIKMLSQKQVAMTLTAYQFLFGGGVLLTTGIFMGGKLQNFSLMSGGLLFYMGIISAVAFSLWTILLKYNPVGKVTIYGFLTPVFGVILSAVFLGENIFAVQNFIALILVCSGIVVSNMTKKLLIINKKTIKKLLEIYEV